MDIKQMQQEFTFVGSQFHKNYRAGLDGRYATFHSAMNLFLHRWMANKIPDLVVETGCQREANDWGAGMSTSIICEAAAKYKFRVVSVDNDRVHLDRCNRFTRKWDTLKVTGHGGQGEPAIRLELSCSVDWLNKNVEPIGLLYLDSYDYPYGQLCDIYGGKTDLAAAESRLNAMTEEEIVQKHGNLIMPCQQHALDEIKAAYPQLNEDSVVLIDDNNLAGGGKPRLAKRWLADQGWVCLLDYQQSLWICA